MVEVAALVPTHAEPLHYGAGSSVGDGGEGEDLRQMQAA